MAETHTSSTGGATPRSTATGDPAQPGIARDIRPGQQSTAQHSGGGIVDRVKDTAAAQLTSQKDRAVDGIGSVTQAVRSSTQKLRDEKHETIASYVDKAADQIENWSRQLREKDVDELFTDLQRLARRQPAVFIGSAFAVGLIAARFLKSSGRQHEDEYPSRPYSSYGSGAQYEGGSQMSTAHDRGALAYGDDIDVEIPTPTSSTSGSASTSGGRNKKPVTRTEKP